MEKIIIDSYDKILVIAPHPDDESIGVGGVIAMYSKLSTVIVATDGSNADSRIPCTQMKALRKREFEEAMKQAGVLRYEMLEIPDGELANHVDCFSNIDFKDYTKVFIPYYKESHPDHMAVYDFVVNEVIEQKAYDTEIYQYETRGTMCNPDVYADITDVLEKKMKMIQSYASQMRLYDHAAFIRDINQRKAGEAGEKGRFFEAFKKIYIKRGQEKEGYELAQSLAWYRRQSEIAGRWIGLKAYCNNISAYLKNNGCMTVCIYGWGYFGKLLFEDLENTDIRIKYVLDKKASPDGKDVNILRPEKKYDDVDIVIVTTRNGSEGIKEELYDIGYERVFTLRDLFIDIEGEHVGDKGK